MAKIQVSNLTFAYDGSHDYVFEDVGFHLDTDWKLGFIGRNGRGKTTFLKLLLGEYDYSGTISAPCDFAYFSYAVRDERLNTIEVVEEVCPDYVYWELMREFRLIELAEDVLYRPFGMLSQGERTKVLLVLLFLKEDRFLLIDEPTNHLDARGRSLVCAYLNGKKGFILVSHDRSFLDNCVDHILSINKTNIEVQRGDFSSWMLNKQRQDDFELAQSEKLKKDMKRLSSAAKRTCMWSDKVEATKQGTRTGGLRPDTGYIGHKSAKMMKRAKSIEKRHQEAFDKKAGLLKNIESEENLKIAQTAYRTDRLVSLAGVSIFYGEQIVCKDVSFEVNQGERIALHGRNGTGKSSVLRLILGEELSYSGECRKGSNLSISYVSQETSFLSGTLSDFAHERGIDESRLKAILRRLDFSREQFEKDMSHFSEGQKKKVLIAGSLCEQAHLLIWDEPLNYIDVVSRMQIERVLLSFEPTILFVEHDAAFCEAIATKNIVLG